MAALYLQAIAKLQPSNEKLATECTERATKIKTINDATIFTNETIEQSSPRIKAEKAFDQSPEGLLLENKPYISPATDVKVAPDGPSLAPPPKPKTGPAAPLPPQ